MPCLPWHTSLLFLPFPSITPFPLTAHLNGYRLILLIWHLARSGHNKWSLFMTNNRGQYPSRTLFGTLHARGKERTVFFTSGEEKSSYSIFSLVLCSARIMLRVKSVQFSLHQVRNSYSIFSGSRTLFGTLRVAGKEHTVFFTSGEEKLSYSVFSLVLYSARIMLGVKNVQFSLRQGRKSKVTAFSLSYSV